MCSRKRQTAEPRVRTHAPRHRSASADSLLWWMARRWPRSRQSSPRFFFRLNLSFVPNIQNLRGSLLLPAVGLIVVAAGVWAAYEFSFVAYTGSTLGLRAVRLQLATFDGSPLTRSLRRWRVLASFLSVLSMGLGYIWCALDEDGLCWHDRITRTHVVPAPLKAKLKEETAIR